MAKWIWGMVYRLLQLILLAILAYGLAHTLPIDLAMLLAGDYLLYFEVMTAAWLAAQATRVRDALAYARAAIGRRLRFIRRWSARSVRNLSRRVSRGRSDEDRPWGGLAPA